MTWQQRMDRDWAIFYGSERGQSPRSMAEQFGLSRWRVRDIIEAKTWEVCKQVAMENVAAAWRAQKEALTRV